MTHTDTATERPAFVAAAVETYATASGSEQYFALVGHLRGHATASARPVPRPQGPVVAVSLHAHRTLAALGPLAWLDEMRQALDVRDADALDRWATARVVEERSVVLADDAVVTLTPEQFLRGGF